MLDLLGPEIITDCFKSTKSNQPHLLFLPVTVPNSFPKVCAFLQNHFAAQ